MDLDSAIDGHVKWRLKLKTAITLGESLDAASIGSDDRCELGKWLNGEGRQKYSGNAEFERMVASHKSFHQAAGRVATAVNAKKMSEAEALLSGPFDTQSKETVASIRACRKVCT